MSRAVGRLQDRQSALRVFEGSRQVTLLFENRADPAHGNSHVGLSRPQTLLGNRERPAIVRRRAGQVPLSEQDVADVSGDSGKVRMSYPLASARAGPSNRATRRRHSPIRRASLSKP